MDFIRQVLSINLIRTRKESNLSQMDIANKLGISVTTYNRWENGVSWPESDSIEKLADIYKIKSSELFTDPDGTKDKTFFTPLSKKELIKDLESVIDKIKKS